MFWRAVVHPRAKASLAEIENVWSFEDLESFDRLVSEIDRAEALAQERAANKR